jgi:sec-independent protein translocase protein TatC
MSEVLEPATSPVDRLGGGRPPAPVAPVPSAPAPPADEKVMSLVDHLAELRRRLFISIVAIVIGGVVGFMLAPQIITILADPLPARDGGTKVQFLTVSGGFFLFMKISFVVGVLLALPVIIYELWAFVSPGLTERERKAALPWIPAAITFFFLGTIVAYVTLPYAIAFLTGWNVEGIAETVPSAEAYYGFVTMIFLLFGLVMEFPIVLVLLAKLGILSIDRLRSSRRMVLLGVVVFAVVATPGGDPISPIVMSGVMYLLYEFTIWMLARGERVGPARA